MEGDKVRYAKNSFACHLNNSYKKFKGVNLIAGFLLN